MEFAVELIGSVFGSTAQAAPPLFIDDFNPDDYKNRANYFPAGASNLLLKQPRAKYRNDMRILMQTVYEFGKPGDANEVQLNDIIKNVKAGYSTEAREFFYNLVERDEYYKKLYKKIPWPLVGIGFAVLGPSFLPACIAKYGAHGITLLKYASDNISPADQAVYNDKILEMAFQYYHIFPDFKKVMDQLIVEYNIPVNFNASYESLQQEAGKRFTTQEVLKFFSESETDEILRKISDEKEELANEIMESITKQFNELFETHVHDESTNKLYMITRLDQEITSGIIIASKFVSTVLGLPEHAETIFTLADNSRSIFIKTKLFLMGAIGPVSFGLSIYNSLESLYSLATGNSQSDATKQQFEFIQATLIKVLDKLHRLELNQIAIMSRLDELCRSVHDIDQKLASLKEAIFKKIQDSEKHKKSLKLNMKFERVMDLGYLQNQPADLEAKVSELSTEIINYACVLSEDNKAYGFVVHRPNELTDETPVQEALGSLSAIARRLKIKVSTRYETDFLPNPFVWAHGVLLHLMVREQHKETVTAGSLIHTTSLIEKGRQLSDYINQVSTPSCIKIARDHYERIVAALLKQMLAASEGTLALSHESFEKVTGINITLNEFIYGAITFSNRCVLADTSNLDTWALIEKGNEEEQLFLEHYANGSDTIRSLHSLHTNPFKKAQNLKLVTLEITQESDSIFTSTRDTHYRMVFITGRLAGLKIPYIVYEEKSRKKRSFTKLINSLHQAIAFSRDTIENAKLKNEILKELTDQNIYGFLEFLNREISLYLTETKHYAVKYLIDNQNFHLSICQQVPDFAKLSSSLAEAAHMLALLCRLNYCRQNSQILSDQQNLLIDDSNLYPTNDYHAIHGLLLLPFLIHVKVNQTFSAILESEFNGYFQSALQHLTQNVVEIPNSHGINLIDRSLHALLILKNKEAQEHYRQTPTKFPNQFIRYSGYMITAVIGGALAYGLKNWLEQNEESSTSSKLIAFGIFAGVAYGGHKTITGLAPRNYLQLGLQCETLELALGYFTKANALHPNHPYIIYCLTNTLLCINGMSNIDLYYFSAMNAHPHRVIHYVGYAYNLLHLMKLPDESQFYFKYALKLTEQGRYSAENCAYKAFIYFFEFSDTKKAVHYLNKSLSHDSNNSLALILKYILVIDTRQNNAPASPVPVNLTNSNDAVVILDTEVIDPIVAANSIVKLLDKQNNNLILLCLMSRLLQNRTLTHAVVLRKIYELMQPYQFIIKSFFNIDVAVEITSLKAHHTNFPALEFNANDNIWAAVDYLPNKFRV